MISSNKQKSITDLSSHTATTGSVQEVEAQSRDEDYDEGEHRDVEDEDNESQSLPIIERAEDASSESRQVATAARLGMVQQLPEMAAVISQLPATATVNFHFNVQNVQNVQQQRCK